MEVILDLIPLQLLVKEAAKSAILRVSTAGIKTEKSLWLREGESLLKLTPF